MHVNAAEVGPSVQSAHPHDQLWLGKVGMELDGIRHPLRSPGGARLHFRHRRPIRIRFDRVERTQL